MLGYQNLFFVYLMLELIDLVKIKSTASTELQSFGPTKEILPMAQILLSYPKI